MISYQKDLINKPVLSIQTGKALAKTSHPIIDPKNLSIMAFELHGRFLNEDSFILTCDIREDSPIGFIINSSDEIVNNKDIIKLKQLLELDFNLINMLVFAQNGQKLGKVIDFTIIDGVFWVYQIIVKRPFPKNIIDDELVINRDHIIDINDKKIIVKDEFENIKPKDLVKQANFNPFRAKKHKSAQAIK